MSDPSETTPADGDSSSSQPPTTPEPSRKARLVQVTIIVALVLAADLASKAWAWGRLREGSPIVVIKNWFSFEFGFNTGSAFSFLHDVSYARVTFIIVTLVALAYMARLAATLPTRFGTAFVAVAMVSGGALGNLHDRLFRIMEIRGAARYGVVDFIKINYWPGKVWPTFNVADVALVVGVGLLLIFLTKHGDALDKATADAKKSSDVPAGEPEQATD